MTSVRTIGWLVCAAFVIVLGVRGLVSNRTAEGVTSSPRSRSSATEEFWRSYRDATTRRIAEDCRGAVPLYEKAVELRPNHEDSLYYLGNCHFELRRYAAALSAYRRLVDINPDGSSRAYMQWALVHASLAPDAPRDLREAQRLFQRALDLDPDSGALIGLAEVALLSEEPKKARLLLERASAEDSMGMAAPYLLGYIASRDGNRAEAWRLFQRAVARGEIKKPAVTWSEEGDVKADPALRWRALARQSVFGSHWIRLRAYVGQPAPARDEMDRDYRLLDAAIRGFRRE